MVDRAVWEKVTIGRAGIRWDSVVEKVWKDLGGNQEKVMSAEKSGRDKTEVEGRIEGWERLALKNKVKSEKYLKIYGEISEAIGMKTSFHAPAD